MTDTSDRTTIDAAPILDVDLLTRTLAHIRAYPQGWNQDDWRRLPGLHAGTPITINTPCGTAMCLAGEAIELVDPQAWIVTSDDIAAAKAVGDVPLMRWQASNLSAVKGNRMGIEHTYTTLTYKGNATRMIFASSYATKLLGLSEHQADVLFASANDLHDLHHLADIIIAGGDVDDYFTTDAQGFHGPLHSAFMAVSAQVSDAQAEVLASHVIVVQLGYSTPAIERERLLKDASKQSDPQQFINDTVAKFSGELGRS